MKNGFFPNIPLIKAQIERQLDEYEQEIRDYAAFMAEWRARQKKQQHPLAAE